MGVKMKPRRRTTRQDEILGWKSPEQERAVLALTSPLEQVVVTIPTGGGKSLLFQLPCTLPGAGMTILVVPLVALRDDPVRRLQKLRIGRWIWQPGDGLVAPLVIVSVEAAATTGFRTSRLPWSSVQGRKGGRGIGREKGRGRSITQ